MMKRNLIKIIASVSLAFSCSFANAQSDFVDLLNAYKDIQSDVQVISKEYLRPYGEMLGRSLNSGWYNSAGVHKLGGFDITVSSTYIKAPSGNTTFDLSKIGLSDKVTLGSETIAPNAAGDMGDRPSISYLGGAEPLAMPNGTGVDFLVMPTIHAAVGLPFHTELAIHYLPKFSLGDFSLGHWGVGLKHSLKDYIPVFKRLPFIRCSVMAAMSQLSGDVGLEYGSGSQSLDIKSSAFTSRLLLGANFPIIALYTGVGLGNAKTDFDLVGDFGDVIGEDPFSLGYKSTAVDFNIGMRLRFGVFAIHADYSAGEYGMVTGGLGINFR